MGEGGGKGGKGERERRPIDETERVLMQLEREREEKAPRQEAGEAPALESKLGGADKQTQGASSEEGPMRKQHQPYRGKPVAATRGKSNRKRWMRERGAGCKGADAALSRDPRP